MTCEGNFDTKHLAWKASETSVEKQVHGLPFSPNLRMRTHDRSCWHGKTSPQSSDTRYLDRTELFIAVDTT